MDYIGSKLKLNKWIFEIIESSTGEPKNKVFLDACSGSGAVSKYAANLGYRVISNDLMYFPSVIVNGSIGLTLQQYQYALNEIKRLNNVDTGLEGYFYNNFCDESNPPRLYFTASNAKLIDRVRQEIDVVDDSKVKDYLLYCGLEAISRVSNTAGVQAAFLKKFKDRAKDVFKLREEKIISGDVTTFNSDIRLLLCDHSFRSKFTEEILYIDPPYNQRQYGPNYHLYETFVKNDNPVSYGKTGLRDWKSECSSEFCVAKKCMDFLKMIVNFTTAKTVFLSYNSDGLLLRDDIEKAFNNIKIYEKEQRRYKADTSDKRIYNNNNLIEYLFEIQTAN